MTDLSALLRDLHDLEGPRQGTPGTPESTARVSGEPKDRQPEQGPVEPHGQCDDCGRSAPVLLVTDYGCRYCRECVTFPPKRVPAPREPTALELEQAGKPLLGHAPEGVALDLGLFVESSGPRTTKGGPQ
jgi:hypothetical protein